MAATRAASCFLFILCSPARGWWGAVVAPSLFGVASRGAAENSLASGVVVACVGVVWARPTRTATNKRVGFGIRHCYRRTGWVKCDPHRPSRSTGEKREPARGCGIACGRKIRSGPAVRVGCSNEEFWVFVENLTSPSGVWVVYAVVAGACLAATGDFALCLCQRGWAVAALAGLASDFGDDEGWVGGNTLEDFYYCGASAGSAWFERIPVDVTVECSFAESGGFADCDGAGAATAGVQFEDDCLVLDFEGDHGSF